MSKTSGTGDSVGFSKLSDFFVAVEEVAENVRRLLHEHGEVSDKRSVGSARYADSVATTVIELCHYGKAAKAEDAIEIAEMVPKLLRALWVEIDVLLER